MSYNSLERQSNSDSEENKMRKTLYVNAVKIFKVNPKHSCCLAARDYKGFGTRWNYMNGVMVNNGTNEEEYEIRRLTPKEYFRLMSIPDEDYEKAAKVNSATQLFKQAGNGLICDIFGMIVKEML